MQEGTDILHTSKLRQRLKEGKTCIGFWLGIADPLAVEALAAEIDVDWAQIDMEHAGTGWQDAKMILLGWKGCTKPLFVRAHSHDRMLLARLLDLGVSGLVIPSVNTPEQAAELVSACRYPPQGTRGFGPRRASNHFTRTEEYLQNANESVFVMVQIEHVRAVENVEAIARTPGLDALFIGPGDLSYSLGVPRQFDHPKTLAAIRKVIKAGRDAGLPIAMAVDRSAAEVLRWVREGIQMATIGLDWMFMREGLNRRASEVRALIESSDAGLPP
jgi:2-keto-3-deoxy-L-rhamnonate aldolase RhmA